MTLSYKSNLHMELQNRERFELREKSCQKKKEENEKNKSRNLWDRNIYIWKCVWCTDNSSLCPNKGISDVVNFFAVLGVSPKSGADWMSALLLSITPDPRQRNFGIH